MADFTEMFRLLGLTLKTAKSATGTHNAFLGHAASFSSPSGHMALSLSLAPERANAWALLVNQFITEGRIPLAHLESLIGTLGFAQAAAFGRFTRAILKPL